MVSWCCSFVGLGLLSEIPMTCHCNQASGSSSLSKIAKKEQLRRHGHRGFTNNGLESTKSAKGLYTPECVKHVIKMETRRA